MQKTIKKRKLNVKTSHSKLMLKGLFESLLTYGEVETTGKKARILRSFADEKLSYALHSKSEKVDHALVFRVGSERCAQKLLRFVLFLKKQGKDMSSGFTSIVRTRYRKGDNSLMFEVKLLSFDDYIKAQKPVKSVKPKTKKSPKASVKKTVSEKAVKTKKEEKSKVPEIKKLEREKEEGFFTKLGERFLGRKSQGPVIERKGRASSRSGI